MRSEIVSQNFSGLAAGSEGVANDSSSDNDPRRLISRPLYLPTDDRPKISPSAWEAGWQSIDPEGYYRADSEDDGIKLRHYEMPSISQIGFEADHYAKLIKRGRAFVPGGVNLISEMGILQTWHQETATRQEAINRIITRGWSAPLEEIRDKENNPNDIFGKNTIPIYYKTLPKLKDRPEDPRVKNSGDWRDSLPSSRRWQEHQLRLRKAIEFIALTEAVVHYRISRGESRKRFAEFLGEADGASAELDARRVYDVMWVEPVVYTIWPNVREPRDVEAQNILASTGLRAQFMEMAGQKNVGALYWILQGVPGRLKTVLAACAVCNSYYGEQAAKCRPVTISPREFETLKKKIDNKHYTRQTPKEFRGKLEDLRTYCPYGVSTQAALDEEGQFQNASKPA